MTNMTTEYEFHDLANIFPMMEEAELAGLTARIKANGLREPIVLHEDKILDGRNRYKARLAASVTPRFEPLPEGIDPLDYVFDLNLSRRHLNNTQREFLAARLASMKKGGNYKTDGPNGPSEPLISQAKAAEKMKVSHRNVKRAAAVIKADPELAKQAEQGKISTSAAEKKTREKQGKPHISKAEEKRIDKVVEERIAKEKAEAATRAPHGDLTAELDPHFAATRREPSTLLDIIKSWVATRDLVNAASDVHKEAWKEELLNLIQHDLGVTLVRKAEADRKQRGTPAQDAPAPAPAAPAPAKKPNLAERVAAIKAVDPELAE